MVLKSLGAAAMFVGLAAIITALKFQQVLSADSVTVYRAAIICGIAIMVLGFGDLLMLGVQSLSKEGR